MNISVIGTGYAGPVVGARLADTGNDVIRADIGGNINIWTLGFESSSTGPGGDAAVDVSPSPSGSVGSRF